MIPMIDLLMVTISFLLITAVWTHMARINADAQVPGPPREVEPDKIEPEKQLHVEMRSPDKFVLVWKQSGTVISTVDVPRKDNMVVKDGKKAIRFPELAQKIEAEWKTVGSHREASDKTEHVRGRWGGSSGVARRGQAADAAYDGDRGRDGQARRGVS